MSDRKKILLGSGYPPGTPMLREELSQGSLRPKKKQKDKKAQSRLERHRKELIDLLGRISDYGNPLESEERIRLIDLNVSLAKKRSDAAKAATEAARAKLIAAKAAHIAPARPPIHRNALVLLPPAPPSNRTYIIQGSDSGSNSDRKDKHREMTNDDDEEAVSRGDCSGEESDCSMTEDDFEATLAPYVKETLKSSLNTKIQIINAECTAEGLPTPARELAVSKAVAELRNKIAGGVEDDDDKFVSDIALKILDEFSIRQKDSSA